MIMHKWRAFGGCLAIWLFPLLWSGHLSAVEVMDIRFGQTEQRARLVIESDQALAFSQRWQSDRLIIELTNLDKSLSQSVLSASALAVSVSLDADKGEIGIPLKRQALIRVFPLAGSNATSYRLVIDWRREANDSPTQAPIIPMPTVQVPESPKQGQIPPVAETAISLKQQAENALTAGDFRKAIALLSKLLTEATSQDKPFVLEFLGVARERNHQLAFAKQYYQQFLAEFPDSENAPRVRQRLNALIGLQDLAKTTTLKGSSRKVGQSQDTTRGSVGVDYRKSDLVNDLGERRETLSLAGVNVDVRGDYAIGDDSLQVRLSAAHYQDLMPQDAENSDRLSYANVSWQSSDRTYRVDVGRQRSRGKGIFSRFDGVLASFGVAEKQRFNLVVGYPVDSSKQLSLDPERQFVSLSYDWEDLFEGFDLSVFAINQTIGSLTDRQAVGGEFKYLQQQTSYYGLVDFDVFYSELNALLISGSHTSESKTRYQWSLNHRKSPYISTRNALIGQPADSLQELQNLFITDEEILDLALDRTLESNNASIQISQPLNKDFDLSGNITWLDLSGAPSSGGVPEISESGGQIYLNVYLSASRLYSERDNSQFGVRYSSLETADVRSVFASTRYRWQSGWSVFGRLRFDDRQSDNGASQQNFSPSMRVQFQNRSHLFYAEFGGIFYTNQSAGFASLSTDIYYLYAGYQYYF